MRNSNPKRSRKTAAMRRRFPQGRRRFSRQGSSRNRGSARAPELGCTERLRPQTKGTPFRSQTAFATFANVYGVVWYLQTSQKNKDFFVCKFVCKFVRSKNSPKKRAYGTPDSHVVPHRSTDEACSGLTAQFGRDTVRFTEYGRRHRPRPIHAYLYRCVPRYFHFNRRRRRARRHRDLPRARAPRRAGRDGRAETHKNGHSPRDDARNICPSPSIERTEARRALCEAARPAAADAPWLGGGGDAETLVRPCVGRLSMVAGTARACCLR